MVSFLVSSCWQVGLLVVQPLFLVFMIDIEKDDTLIRHALAVVANRFQAPVVFPAGLTIIVDQTVFSPSHVFLEFAAMGSVHLAISDVGILQDAVNHLPDPFVSTRIVSPDLVDSCFKMLGGLIEIGWHRILLFHGRPVFLPFKMRLQIGSK